MNEEKVNSIYVIEGPNKGRIADDPTNEKDKYNTAHKIALKEKEEGRDAALRLEGALENELNTGLSERESFYNEILQGIEQKYPNAFKKVLTPKGNEVLVLENLPMNDWDNSQFPYDYTFSQTPLIITRQGIYSVEKTYLDLNEANFDPLLEELATIEDTSIKGSESLEFSTAKIYPNRTHQSIFKLIIWDIRSKEHLSSLSQAFKYSENIKHAKKTNEKEPSPKDVLDQL